MKTKATRETGSKAGGGLSPRGLAGAETVSPRGLAGSAVPVARTTYKVQFLLCGEWADEFDEPQGLLYCRNWIMGSIAASPAGHVCADITRYRLASSNGCYANHETFTAMFGACFPSASNLPATTPDACAIMGSAEHIAQVKAIFDQATTPDACAPALDPLHSDHIESWRVAIRSDAGYDAALGILRGVLSDLETLDWGTIAVENAPQDLHRAARLLNTLRIKFVNPDGSAKETV